MPGAAGGGPSPAAVSVFNLFNEPVTGLSVAGYGAGDVAEPANGATPPGVPVFTPASLTVPRTRDPTSFATFAIGDNDVTVPWVSFRGRFTVTIPDPKTTRVALTDPLVLGISVGEAVLLDGNGYVLGTFPVALADLRRLRRSGR
jgi:hypothetical protein